MYRLIRFYNRNRKKILIIILIIAFLFAILRVANSLEKNKVEKTAQVNITKEQETISNSVTSNKSLISGTTLDSKTIAKDTAIIEEFLKYCQQYNIDNAYNLISNDCKEQLFETKESFKENYLDIIFNNKDVLYTIENWYDYTYKINITDNILSTGKAVNYSKQDYITIVQENEEQKLNINKYIGETKINHKEQVNNVKIEVQSQYQYMDYIIYSLEINNNNEYSILLDNLEKIDDTFILDQNEAKYYLYTHEIKDNQLLISPQRTKKIKLKFYSKNILSKTINRIAFKNVILNYGKLGAEEKTEYIIKFRN